MDEKLSKVYGTCSRETFEFVMELRRLQRKYSMETYTSSIMDYPENVRKNLVKGDIFFSMFFSGPKDEELPQRPEEERPRRPEEELPQRPEEERQMLCEKITEMTKILKNS